MPNVLANLLVIQWSEAEGEDGNSRNDTSSGTESSTVDIEYIKITLKDYDIVDN